MYIIPGRVLMLFVYTVHRKLTLVTYVQHMHRRFMYIYIKILYLVHTHT